MPAVMPVLHPWRLRPRPSPVTHHPIPSPLHHGCAATTQQHRAQQTFAAFNFTWLFSAYLDPIILHHDATWLQVTPAIPFLSPPRVSSTPSARASSPHKGPGSDAVVSKVRYRQLPSVGAVEVARSWRGIVRNCIVTTTVTAGSIAPRHVIVPSHTIIPISEVVSTVWSRCSMRVRVRVRVRVHPNPMI